MTRHLAKTRTANGSDAIVMEGTLWKKGRKISPTAVWNERRFVLRGNNLSYYTNSTENTPKGTFTLIPGCRISSVYEWKEKKPSSSTHHHHQYPSSLTENQPPSAPTTELSTLSRKPKIRRSYLHNSDKPKKHRYCIKITWPNPNANTHPYGDFDSDLEDDAIPELLPPPTGPSTPTIKNTKSDDATTQSRPVTPLTTLTRAYSAAAITGMAKSHRRATSNSSALTAISSIKTSTPTIKISTPSTTRSKPRSRSAREIRSQSGTTDRSTSIDISSHSFASDSVANDPIPDDEFIESEKPPSKRRLSRIKKNPTSTAVATRCNHTRKWKTSTKTRKRIAQGGSAAAAAGAVVTAGILTSGVGIASMLIFVGVSAAAGGSGALAGRSYYRKYQAAGTTLILASQDYSELEKWRASIEAAISGDTRETETWMGLFQREGRSTTECLMPTRPKEMREGCLPLEADVLMPRLMFENTVCWRPLEGGWALLMGCGAQGLRMFQEEKVRESTRRLSVEGSSCPPLKAQLILNATPLNAFMCLMSHSRIDNHAVGMPFSPRSQQRASFRIIQTLDDHMDVIHLVFRPLYLFPSWTSPRDFCLRRYWRFEDDGSYVVCYDSIEHRDCVPVAPYVRGNLHGVFTIAPRKKRGSVVMTNATTIQPPAECLLNYFVQVDPRGWIPTIPLPFLASQGYAEAFTVSALLQMLDVKDALDHDRFVSVSLDNVPRRCDESVRGNDDKKGARVSMIPEGLQTSESEDPLDDMWNYDYSYAEQEFGNKMSGKEGGIAAFPTPLKAAMWVEPDAKAFRVRGKTYKKDKIKINAGESLFRLICVDLVEVGAPIMTGMCSHPKERVQQALAKGLDGDCPPFVITINIVLPGPPYYHLVIYYAVDDIKQINGEAGTPFSKLANEFFFGDSDEFRHSTFKLIPQIVQGNFLVRKAVGSTPAIMGKQLTQTYVKGERFFELILDVGSSSVAAGVVKLSVGYTKTLQTDMAFLLEGNDESTLPERVLGCCRLKNVEFKNLRFVDQVEDCLDIDE